MSRKILGSSLLVVLILVWHMGSFATQQKNQQVNAFFSQRALTEMNLFAGRSILTAKEKIQLTQPQQDQIENLMLSFEEFAISQCAAIKIKELRLARYLKSEHFDRQKLEQFVREISKMKIDLSAIYLNYLLDIRELLTQDQQRMLAEIRKDLLKKKRKPVPHSRVKNPPITAW